MRLSQIDAYVYVLLLAAISIVAFVTFQHEEISHLLFRKQPKANIIHSSFANLNLNNINVILRNSMRILCICQTTAPRHQERAVHVKATWGRRCNKLIFASDTDDLSLPAFKFADQPGRQFVTFKMRGALQWAHDCKLSNDKYVVEFSFIVFLRLDS